MTSFYTFITLFSFCCPPTLTCDSKTPLIKSENSGHPYFVSGFNGLKFPIKPEMVFRLRKTYFTKNTFLLYFDGFFKKSIMILNFIRCLFYKNDHMIFSIYI